MHDDGNFAAFVRLLGVEPSAPSATAATGDGGNIEVVAAPSAPASTAKSLEVRRPPSLPCADSCGKQFTCFSYVFQLVDIKEVAAPVPALPATRAVPAVESLDVQLAELQQMGFSDATRNRWVLEAMCGDVAAALDILLGEPSPAAQAPEAP